MAIDIKVGQRPVRFNRGGKPHAPETIAAMKACQELQPGQWFVWEDAPKHCATVVRKLRVQGVRVEAYRDLEGRVIVTHLDGQDRGLKSVPRLPEVKAEAKTTPQTTEISKPISVARDSGRGAWAPSGEQEKILKALRRAGRKLKRTDLAAAIGVQRFPFAPCEELKLHGLVVMEETGTFHYVGLSKRGEEWAAQLA